MAGQKAREVKAGDSFDGYEVVGNRCWSKGAKGWVWDVRNPEGVIITITEAAIHQYVAADQEV